MMTDTPARLYDIEHEYIEAVERAVMERDAQALLQAKIVRDRAILEAWQEVE